MHWIDPQSLPETKHRVRQFLVNPEGYVEGFISVEGQQVLVPPHLGRALTRAVTAGDLVYARGIKPRNADVIAAVLIESAHGLRIEDHGTPDRPRAEKRSRTAKREMEGEVERVLYGPRGERRGLLFQNGVTVHFAPELAEDLEEFLTPGIRMFVSGNLRTTKWGTVLDADYFWHPSDEDISKAK
ncbi:hypothetical protein [Dyella acidiphila]|uniref:Uncharacterized protein n=1 Tax=Dyella acidiphila TaxID=2775866 RepID=A0ABR9GBZ2_9GAMM|nr:hypothetical protein [Dyella acidiphila]MBE1161555.1 hypothetical protein [Dyella acidiphila]